MTNLSAEKDIYSYRVTWSPEDNEYVGLCTEFPSLSWLAESPEEALRGIRQVVAEVIKDLRASGEDAPEPLAGRHYSGVFTVRVPPYVHKSIALKAAEANVSLNRFVSSVLAAQ